jgi:Protein of unknown function (DUF3489)
MPKHSQAPKPVASPASKRTINSAAQRATHRTTAEAKGLDNAEKQKDPQQLTKAQSGADKKQTAKQSIKTARSRKPPPQNASAAITRKPVSSEHRRSKQDTVIALLQQPMGTTIAAMMAATGWQQHSVRGFLAGVVRKRFGLDLVSEKTDQGRVYRIARKSAAGGKSRRKAA